MKKIAWIIVAVLVGACAPVRPVAPPSLLEHFPKDRAVRAFFGIRALREEFAAEQPGFLYAVTYAKFEDGKFIGFGCLETGVTTTKPSLFELAWRKVEDHWVYVLVTPVSTSTGSDPFFGYLATSSDGQSSQGINLEFLQQRERYKDWYVLAFARGGPNIECKADLEVLGRQYNVGRYTLLLLVKECPKGEDYLKMLGDFGESDKEPNQALVPTPASVTPAAGAPVAPDAGAAHL